jgi:nucleoside-diphosphate-sugar epimerase
MSVHDAARAILLIAEAAVSDPTNVPRLINIASGEERKIADMALMMKKIVVPEADVEITFSGKITPGDPVNWGADIRALLELINDWKTAPLEDALRATVAAWDVDVKK